MCVLDDRYAFAGALAGINKPYSEWMQSAHGRLAGRFNKREKRQGPLGMKRPTTHTTPDEETLKRLMFALDYLPVRIGLVDRPEDHEYTTYNYYAHGRQLPWMAEFSRPAWYEALGKTEKRRQRRYRRLAREYYQRGKLDECLTGLLEGREVGPKRFKRIKAEFMNSVRSHQRRKHPFTVEELDWLVACALRPYYTYAMAVSSGAQATAEGIREGMT